MIVALTLNSLGKSTQNVKLGFSVTFINLICSNINSRVAFERLSETQPDGHTTSSLTQCSSPVLALIRPYPRLSRADVFGQVGDRDLES